MHNCFHRLAQAENNCKQMGFYSGNPYYIFLLPLVFQIDITPTFSPGVHLTLTCGWVVSGGGGGMTHLNHQLRVIF